jgi:hypothetical protein
VHCPNCGTRTTSEQKFCRACGMALDKVAQILAEQLPEVVPDEDIRRRKRRVELLLTALVGGMIGTLVISMIWVIVVKIIIRKGEVLEGSIFLGFIIAAAIALALVFYRESLLEREAKRAAPSQTQLPPAPGARGLPEPSFEPVPSVTDRTTELLAAERRRDTREV